MGICDGGGVTEGVEGGVAGTVRGYGSSVEGGGGGRGSEESCEGGERADMRELSWWQRRKGFENEHGREIDNDVWNDAGVE